MFQNSSFTIWVRPVILLMIIVSGSASALKAVAPVVNGAVKNVSCAGYKDGNIILNVSGGVPPYQYQWSTGATTTNLFGLSGGAYQVTVTGSDNDSTVRSFVINEPAPLMLSLTANHATCGGAPDGGITTTISGGAPPYSFSWSNGSTGQNLANVYANTYSVVVTDKNGCMISATITISSPPPLHPITSSTPADCSANDGGTASISAIGGNPPYTFMWSTGDTTSTITDLSKGLYYVTVTDAIGCTASAEEVVRLASPCNNPPDAHNDSVSISVDSTVTIDVLTNDFDPDGNIDSSSVTIIMPPQNGSATVNADGTIEYIPNSGFSGVDSLQYLVCDTGYPVYCDTATVYISIADDDSVACVKVRVYLEGAYDSLTNSMTTKLNTFCNALPQNQPYNSSPWMYPGTENTPSFRPDITGWVLLSFRTSPLASSEINRQAVLLRNDGLLVATSGDSLFCVTIPPADSVYVVVQHRNHLGIMSASAIKNSGGAVMMDFRRSQSYTIGLQPTAGQKIIDTVAGQAVYGMFSGDADGNWDINSNDYTPIGQDFGKFNLYSNGDLNLDCDVNSNDIPHWVENFNKFSGVGH